MKVGDLVKLSRHNTFSRWAGHPCEDTLIGLIVKEDNKNPAEPDYAYFGVLWCLDGGLMEPQVPWQTLEVINAA